MVTWMKWTKQNLYEVVEHFEGHHQGVEQEANAFPHYLQSMKFEALLPAIVTERYVELQRKQDQYCDGTTLVDLFVLEDVVEMIELHLEAMHQQQKTLKSEQTTAMIVIHT